MGKTTYSRGQYEAIVIFKATDRRHGQVWIPELTVQRSCSNGIEGFQLTDWVLYDVGSDQVIGRVEVPPYETKKYTLEEKRIFAQIKVPLVFFSDEKFQLILAHSQGFGRIGCFQQQQQHARTLDKLQYAWIIFIGQHQDVNWQKLKKALNFNWMVTELEAPLSKQQVISAQQAGHVQLTNGIVVDREEGVHMGSEKNGFTVWTVFKLWTADPMRGICTYRVANGQPEVVDGGRGGNQARLEVGTFCRFFAAANWSNTSGAASPIVVSPPAGISIVDPSGPSLKLKVEPDHYTLDQGPEVEASSEVHIPDWIGTLQCQRPFVEDLRRARSQLVPRLYIEYSQRTDSWAVVHFDGRASSPPPWLPSSAVTGRAQQQQPKPGGDDGGGGKKSGIAATAAADQRGWSNEQFMRSCKRTDFPSSMGTGANTAPLGIGGGSNFTGGSAIGGVGGFGQSRQQAKFVRPPSSASGDVETPGGFGRSRHSRPPSAASNNTHPPEIDSSFARSTTPNAASTTTASAPPRKMDDVPPPRKIDLVPVTTKLSTVTIGTSASGAASSSADRVLAAGGSFGASHRGNFQASSSSLKPNKSSAAGNTDVVPPSNQSRSRSPSVCSDFSQSSGRIQQRQQQQQRGDKQQQQTATANNNTFSRFATTSSTRGSSAPFPSHQQQRPPSFTNGHSSSFRPPPPGVATGANAIRPGQTTAVPPSPSLSTTSTSRFSSSSRGGRGAPDSRVKTNLHGLVVATTEGGFLIYTPSYPKTELYLARTLLSEVSAGLKHGSWLRFNAQDGVDGKPPHITSIIGLEKEAPFQTQIVQNTVQLRLNAFVPRRWNPSFSTFEPLVKTEFIEEVVDSRGLLSEDCADQQIPVLVMRARDPLFPHIPWRIEKLLD